MKFSLNWINRYTSLPINDLEELNKIIDRIALQIVDVDERWVGLKDSVIDVDNKIITNRPYDFGHRGMAREISVMLGHEYTGNKYPLIPKKTTDLPINIKVEDPELCPRFASISIKGVKIGPSPEWLKDLLESIGQRSINNLVDITNFVMWDTAQPVHAYDYDKIKNAEIIVRRAKEGERIKTLDGVERILNKDNLLITDVEKAVGIAGVMGGGNSEIDENTTNIILEVASFNPINIRKTAKFLKHRTDAVTRFEKGVDPTNIENVISLLTNLIIENCGGEVASDLIDINNLKYSTIRTENLEMEFNPLKVTKLLGFSVQDEFIEKVFDGFDIKYDIKSNDLWDLSIPPFRADIKEKADLIEDIGRMYGYQNIPDITPVNKLIAPKKDKKVIVREKIRETLISSGLDEVITYSFISQKDADAFGGNENLVNIINPLSEEYIYLRNSLLPSLSKVVSLNSKYLDNFGIFEIAKRFEKNQSERLDYDKDKGISLQPIEVENISMMFYNKNEKEKSIYRLKGAFENLMEKLGIQNSRISDNGYKINSDGTVKLDKKIIGKFGLLTKDQLKSFDIPYSVSYLELDLEQIYDNFEEIKQYKEFSKYQGSKLDYSILILEKTPAEDLLDKISSLNNSLIKTVNFTGDIYRDKAFDGKKSVSIMIQLQKDNGNLTDDEIYNTALEIENAIKSINSAEIRGGGVQRKETSNQTIIEQKPILAAEILSIENHPNADRLVVTQINVGNEQFQIVTGAPNIHVGDIVPVALPGVTLPIKDEKGNPITMKVAKLRGVDSYGMMLADDEMGIGGDHSGIHILDKAKFKPGDVVKPEEL